MTDQMTVLDLAVVVHARRTPNPVNWTRADEWFATASRASMDPDAMTRVSIATKSTPMNYRAHLMTFFTASDIQAPSTTYVFIAKIRSMIVIAIPNEIDLAHNTPVILEANERQIKGYVDRNWLKMAFTKGCSSRPCAKCRNLSKTPLS